MATNNLSFSAQVNSFVRQTEQRMTAVFRESAQRVASLASNGVPVDTGFARASVRASTESMPGIDSNASGGAVNAGAFAQVTLVIAGASIGQTIYVGWTANYILPLEYGHSQQAPSGFVRIAAMQWKRIVAQVSSELKSRVGSK